MSIDLWAGLAVLVVIAAATLCISDVLNLLQVHGVTVASNQQVRVVFIWS